MPTRTYGVLSYTYLFCILYRIQNSYLRPYFCIASFEFPVEFILDCWGAIVDAQNGQAHNGQAAAASAADTNF